MTSYNIIYMVAIVSVVVSALLGYVVFLIDEDANRNDKKGSR